MVFDKIEYSWPIVSALLLVAAMNDGKLEIIDFGGSLGSSYFQNRKFLSQLKKVSWNIVEQKNFVECGQKYFQDENLKFYFDIASCLQENKPSAILLSNVLQYLEKPYEMLDQIISYEFSYIIFDMISFNSVDEDIITIQKVWPEVYQATYPCWFFNKKKFLEKFEKKYEIIEEFASVLGKDIKIDENYKTNYSGLILKLKNVIKNN